MPVPIAYTEDSLARFQLIALGDLAAALGWVPEDPRVQDAVIDALLAYHDGPGTIADATDVAKLRAVGRVAIWRAVARATAGHYRFSTDAQSFDRQQVHEHAVAMLAGAEREALEAGAGATLVVTPVVYAGDPYSYLPPELRTLP